MFEEEYLLPFFEENNYTRKVCKSCGSGFWTIDPGAEVCGDTPCAEYSFIGAPLTRRSYDIDAMRELYVGFFRKRGHTLVERYPVIPRWRDDVLLVNASIYDFQPHVTSGQVEPPANPLVVSQPCIRMTDIDSVGKTGKHISSFEMMAHHAFNTQDNVVYWKDQTVRYCHELLTKDLGVQEPAITYKEHPWIGGGNAGPSLEVIVGGLELATLVFMNLKRDKAGKIELDGEHYSPLALNVVDTGYGLERFVWASQGTPTIYECVFPEMLERLFEVTGVEHGGTGHTAKVLAEHAKLAGVMDIGTEEKLSDLRARVVKRLGAKGVSITIKEFQGLMEPLEKIYTIADHTKTLALMLSDGIVPSNVKTGYLARLVIRRTLRIMEELKVDVPLSELVGSQLVHFKAILDQSTANVVREMVELETERYGSTIRKGTSLVRSQLEKQRGKPLSVDSLIQFYDTHGIPPSMVADIGSELGVPVEVPDDFGVLLSRRQDGSALAESQVEERGFDLPATENVYYEEPEARECDATVLHSDGREVVLDRSIFYPEGGGQPCDLGTVGTEGKTLNVEGVQRHGDVIVIELDGEAPTVGEKVHCIVDWERRMGHCRHHTGTHLIIGACRQVLGKHIWQSGSQNMADQARIDIAHFRPITTEELERIELLANEKVMEGVPVEREWLDRGEAEKRYGFGLYQGGAPTGTSIRVVRISDFDVEGCGGTHCTGTGQVGPIKIRRTERIQDGVERITFSAGPAAIKYVQGRERLLQGSSDVLSVAPEQLPKAVQRFFDEWKERGKENENLRKQLAKGPSEMGSPIKYKNEKYLVGRVPDGILKQKSKSLAKEPGTTYFLAGEQSGLIMTGSTTQTDCKALYTGTSAVVPWKGGGSDSFLSGKIDDVNKIPELLKIAEQKIKEEIDKKKKKSD